MINSFVNKFQHRFRLELSRNSFPCSMWPLKTHPDASVSCDVSDFHKQTNRSLINGGILEAINFPEDCHINCFSPPTMSKMRQKSFHLIKKWQRCEHLTIFLVRNHLQEMGSYNFCMEKGIFISRRWHNRKLEEKLLNRMLTQNCGTAACFLSFFGVRLEKLKFCI